MKILNPILAFLAVTSLAIVVLAAKNKKATVTYYYICGTAFGRLTPGIVGGPLVERSLNQTVFENTSNWTTTPQSFTVTCDMSQYIGSITFDEEATADGGSDGQLTLQEVLTAVYAQYAAPNPDVMQACYKVDGSAMVCVTAATEVCQ